MKVVQINTVCSGSTGKIATQISKMLNKEGIQNYIFYAMGKSDYKNAVKYANFFLIKINALFAKVFGNYGFNSKIITKRLINNLKKIKPDVVHLHNIHGHNVNLLMLFDYLKKNNVKIVWTFHDCWAFTGYCVHFDYEKCDKWKMKCGACPQRKRYSYFFDRSAWLYEKKKELFTGFKDFTVVTPSKWLAELVKNSFLREYSVKVIYNGVDTELFCPIDSDFRKKFSLENKIVLLGTAMSFNEKKGFEYFLKLSKSIPDNMRIVLVGVNEKQIKNLPENIIGIEKTENQRELAEIYSAADVFINLTLEDNFPTVNLEALACGTPVITFDTGGSGESIDENTGIVVEKGNINGVIKGIDELIGNLKSSACARETAVKKYDAKKSFAEYLNIYNG